MKKPLWEDILKFHKSRITLGVLLVILGIFGLLIPIIPGLIVILLGLALLAPDTFGSVLEWMRDKPDEDQENKND